jgi:hypothetical protein
MFPFLGPFRYDAAAGLIHEVVDIGCVEGFVSEEELIVKFL